MTPWPSVEKPVCLSLMQFENVRQPQRLFSKMALLQRSIAWGPSLPRFEMSEINLKDGKIRLESNVTVCLTRICPVDFSILINWTFPFPISGVSGLGLHYLPMSQNKGR